MPGQTPTLPSPGPHLQAGRAKLRPHLQLRAGTKEDDTVGNTDLRGLQ